MEERLRGLLIRSRGEDAFPRLPRFVMSMYPFSAQHPFSELERGSKLCLKEINISVDMSSLSPGLSSMMSQKLDAVKTWENHLWNV